jgi:hypothetical protein
MSIHNCKLLDLPKIVDSRGNLSFVESNIQIPFEIKRIYYLYDVPGGSERAGHAHKKLHQLIIPISGSFDIKIDDGLENNLIHLYSANKGLYLPPMIWRDLNKFSSGSVCLVLASDLFHECDYLRNYDDFISEVKKLK